MGSVTLERRRYRHGLLWLCTCLLGCGGATAGSSGRVADNAVIVAAPGAGVSSYSTTPTEGAVIGGPAAAGVDRGILRAAQGTPGELVADGRLSRLAAWTAESLGEGGALPQHEVIEFFARRLGLVEPVPHLFLLGQSDASMLERGIADRVSSVLARQSYNRYGAAVVQRGVLTLAVIALSSRSIELSPIPRRMPAGSSVRLRGRLLDGHRNPTVVVARPDGSVGRFSIDDGTAIDINVPTSAAGTYRLEVLAEGRRGETVVANFPLYVGVDVPDQVSVQGHDASESPEGVSRALLRLINRARRDRGMVAVEVHDGLAQVAGAHSQDMVAHGFVGHESPTTGNAGARIRRAGLDDSLVLENIGRGYSADGIHSGLLASPAHRANILNPDVTHVGLGVVAEEEGERTAFVVTQVFVRMAHAIDTSDAPGRLLAMINRTRAARGAPLLEAEPNLREAAQAGVLEFFEDATLTQQDVLDDASASLRRFNIAFSRVGGLMAVVSRIEDASQLEPAFDPELRYIGIGVAQGDRPDTGGNAIGVVILLAWPR